MNGTYTPRPGSRAEAAIVALQKHGRMSAVDLSDEIEVERPNLDGNLAIAIRFGAIRKVDVGGRPHFELGDGSATAGLATQAPRAKTPRELPPQKRNRALAAAAPAIDPPGSVAIKRRRRDPADRRRPHHRAAVGAPSPKHRRDGGAVQMNAATHDELREAYEASTFPRTLTFEAACALQWSRAALELGALIRRAPAAAQVDAPPRPRPPLQRRLPL